jgi:hypothetical protein
VGKEEDPLHSVCSLFGDLLRKKVGEKDSSSRENKVVEPRRSEGVKEREVEFQVRSSDMDHSFRD